jgi:hypothetical protein
LKAPLADWGVKSGLLIQPLSFYDFKKPSLIQVMRFMDSLNTGVATFSFPPNNGEGGLPVNDNLFVM